MFVVGVCLVYFCVVYWIVVLCDLKCVVVDDVDDENCFGDICGVELWDDLLDDVDVVEFVFV